jgi:hypothetical protein
MQLHKVPRCTWVRVIDPDKVPPAAPEPVAGERIFFDHIDGMYSYCEREDGSIIHLVAWQEVKIDDDQG